MMDKTVAEKLVPWLWDQFDEKPFAVRDVLKAKNVDAILGGGSAARLGRYLSVLEGQMIDGYQLSRVRYALGRPVRSGGTYLYRVRRLVVRERGVQPLSLDLDLVVRRRYRSGDTGQIVRSEDVYPIVGVVGDLLIVGMDYRDGSYKEFPIEDFLPGCVDMDEWFIRPRRTSEG